MSKTTASAAGGAMPAADHPDAALFTLAEECIAAASERDETLDRLNDAEENHFPIPTPEAVLRTEKDVQLRIYVGGGLGTAYNREEIAAIRIMVRTVGRDPNVTRAQHAAYTRGAEILDAWAGWREMLDREEERSGMAAATRAYHGASDKFDEVAGKLATTSAATIDGVMAKTRALAHLYPDDALVGEGIKETLRQFGPEQDVASASLARDLIRLVKSEGAAQ